LSVDRSRQKAQVTGKASDARRASEECLVPDGGAMREAARAGPPEATVSRWVREE
jgi:hypothetical protein